MPKIMPREKQRDSSSGSYRYAILVALALFFLPSFLSAQTTAKEINGTTITLISNSGECLVDCEAWIEWDLTASPTTIKTSSVPSSQFNFEVIKKIGSKGLADFGVEVWEQKDISVVDYCQIEKIVFVDDKNGSLKCGQASCPVPNLVTESCGTHIEKQWQKIADSVYGFTAKQQKYRLRIWGKKFVGLGNNVDWVPTILGTKIGEWAWWNADYTEKRVINDLVVASDLGNNALIRIENIDFGNLNFACVDLNDLRIVDELTNNELSRIVEGDRETIDGNIVFRLENSLAAGTHSKRFFVYYNNTACPEPDSFIWQDFNSSIEFTTEATGAATVSFLNLAKTSVLKKSYATVQFVSDNENNAQTTRIATNETTSDTNIGVWIRTTAPSLPESLHINIDGVIISNGGDPNLSITGSGEDYVILAVTANTWYYLIFERKAADKLNAYAFNESGEVVGEAINKTPSANWTQPATIDFQMRDYGAATSYYDEVYSGVTVFPKENICSYSLEESVSLVDVNVTKIDDTYFFNGMSFNKLNDGNLTITISVQNMDNNRLLLDLNYSTTGTNGTGNNIVKDLNLSSTCDSLDWADAPTNCTWDWDISSNLVTDGNYYITANLKSVDSTGTILDTDFNKSNFPVNIINDFNLVIKRPIDEASGSPITGQTEETSSAYRWTIRIWDASGMKYYTGQIDDNGFMVSRGSTNIIIEIDTNTTDYFARQYSFDASTIGSSYVLQPYLTKQTVSGNFIFNVVNIETLAPIPGVEIRVTGFIPALGEQSVQIVTTDSTGLATIPLRLSSPYIVKFYYQGALVHTANITPTAASLYYSAKLNISSTTTEPTITKGILVKFFPETIFLWQKSNGSVDINISISSLNNTISDIRIRILDNNGCLFDDNVFIGPWTDGNTVYYPRLDLNAGDSKNIFSGAACGFSDQYSVYARVDVNSTDGNQYTVYSMKWQLVTDNNYKYNLMYLLPQIGLSLNGNSGNKMATTFIAFLVLIAAVSAVGAVTGGEPIMAAMMTLAILGFFVIIGFVDVIPFGFICLATFFGIVYMWGRFG